MTKILLRSDYKIPLKFYYMVKFYNHTIIIILILRYEFHQIYKCSNS